MTKLKKTIVLHILVGLFLVNVGVLDAADWPMWRYDAARTSSSPEQLAGELHLQWARKLAKPQPAWPPHQYKLQFDVSYEPVVMGDSIFIPSMVTDSVTAYNTETGAEKWRFYTDGPVRFAPVAWEGALYLVSDDGYLYCLNAENGSVKWKFRGGPSDRKILGNDRLISTWCARGAPVIYDGVVYFAAGIWPFMGTFIHALDAASGQVVWTNSETGPIFVRQPHGEPAFSGVAPQGYMAACEDKLIVTGGRSRPAVFDRKTGRLLYFKHSDRSEGKFRGGYDIAIWRQWFFNFDVMYNLSDGGAMGTVSAPVLSQDAVIGLDSEGAVMGYVPAGRGKAKGLWKAAIAPKINEIYLRAGARVYGTDENGIVAVDVPEGDREAAVSWRYELSEKVFTMLAADEKLFVVTTAGSVYCFGAEKTQPRYYDRISGKLYPTSKDVDAVAAAILDGRSKGRDYCLVLGVDEDGLLGELIAQSELHIIVIDPNDTKVADLRSTLSRAGLLGTRAAVLAGDIESIDLPPYFASLIVSQAPDAITLDDGGEAVAKLFECLRPYGGTAYLPFEVGPGRRSQPGKWIGYPSRGKLQKAIKAAKLASASVSYKDGLMRLERVGALPGSADWTHQYGDVANTVCSKDSLIKAPLGLLWFGDHVDFGEVLPRHGHGPPEQVVAGRLVIQGLDSISARDVYTGRTLWKTQLKNLNAFDVYYDNTFVDDFRDTTYNQVHIAGANARGANFVATADSVYIIQDRTCDVLDAATGVRKNVFKIPALGDEDAEWAYIGVYKDYLIAGANFAEYSKLIGADKGWLRWLRYADKIASKELVVMDRHTGKIRWRKTAKFGFVHNAIAVGKGRIFCIDEVPPFVMKSADADRKNRLLAINVRTGKVMWEKDDDVFGGWLGYSEDRDILIQGDWPEGDDMGPWKNYDRIIAWRGRDGKVLWDKPITYNGPYILHNDTIITQRVQDKTARGYSLLTGEEITRIHPITGETVPWEFMRLKGCNTTVGAEHLLTFRSAAAGFFDLANDGGTGNLGGFKSGCTSNLVVANGVLNAPDYTQTCTCSFQNQTSLALVHMPEADMWTFNTIAKSDKPVQRAGINFGAPGDRKTADGTLWLDYPSVGGTSPNLEVKILPAKPQWYRSDTSQIAAGPHKWVTASGAKGLEEIRIKLAADDVARPYTVRLYFAEPEQTSAGERIFDVAIQGKKVLEKFDITAQTGGPNIGIVKEFGDVQVAGQLVIKLESTGQKKSVISGVEIVAGGKKASD